MTLMESKDVASGKLQGARRKVRARSCNSNEMNDSSDLIND